MRKNTINFISNFKKIIQVKIDHNFFTNEDYIFTDFNPDEISKLTIKNYGLIFRKIQNGFVLLSNFNERFSSKVFGGVVNLNFNFKILDSNFLNYTDIPYNNDQKFVFKNNFIKTNTGSNSKKTEYLLHENNYASSTDILEKKTVCYLDQFNLELTKMTNFLANLKKIVN